MFKHINKKKFIETSAFLLILIVISIAIFSPLNSKNTFIPISLSVATFLFGIFVGFSISDRHARIEKIRANDSSERSNLVSIYGLSQTFGKKVQKQTQHLIDLYLMATLDYTIWDFSKTQKEFNGLFNFFENFKFNDKKGKEITVFREIVRRISDNQLFRGETAELIDERISKFEWAIFSFFGVVILVSLILLNTGGIISVILITALCSAIIFLTYFLYDLDSLSWKAEARIFEPYAETFEAVGLLRYYPEDLIITKRVKRYKDKSYRIGHFPNPYPDFSGKKIEIVK